MHKSKVSSLQIQELVFGSVVFVVLVGVILLSLFISRRRYGPTSTIPHTHSTAINSHSGQGQPLINGYASRENNNTPENNSAEAEICYAPSVEVKESFSIEVHIGKFFLIILILLKKTYTTCNYVFFQVKPSKGYTSNTGKIFGGKSGICS